jgi:prophage regulatory protein
MQTQSEIARAAMAAKAAYLSDRQVGERYSVSRQTAWTWLKRDETFPKPVSLSPGCTRWRLADLEQWEAARRGAA